MQLSEMHVGRLILEAEYGGVSKRVFNFNFRETDWTCLFFFILRKQSFLENSVLRNVVEISWNSQQSENVKILQHVFFCYEIFQNSSFTEL